VVQGCNLRSKGDLPISCICWVSAKSMFSCFNRSSSALINADFLHMKEKNKPSLRGKKHQRTRLPGLKSYARPIRCLIIKRLWTNVRRCSFPCEGCSRFKHVYTSC
jgi:hypothetical protein